jgi:hypothetical protein
MSAGYDPGCYDAHSFGGTAKTRPQPPSVAPGANVRLAGSEMPQGVSAEVLALAGPAQTFGLPDWKCWAIYNGMHAHKIDGLA